ncbi:MAG: NAD-glutamate dehydrogenase [Actinomycetota bacterium]|nr:NAD-glutamate dehydrogenase [Actinomycetota bacterium]
MARTLSKLDEAKADLLRQAAEVGERGRSAAGDERYPGLDLEAYLSRYYRHVAPEDLLGRDPVDVFGAALTHWQLAATRPQGTALVRVLSPSAEEHGWSSPHSVAQVITDDMPFLVDSVTAELAREGRSIHLIVHPQLRVVRDITGRLLELCTDPGGGIGGGVDARDGEVVESWMHVEIDRDTDLADLRHLERAFQRVLRDVREAVEDWQKMQSAAQGIAEELAAAPPAGLPAVEVEEARELLTWLCEGHFTFIGYREYGVAEQDGELALQVVAGTGLGILRSDDPHEWPLQRLSEQLRVRALEKRLLILTKANSRSTVHRNSYLDYLGVKKFDASGEVVGERRFLGLFTSSAYNESVRRVPVVRRKVAEVLARTGFPANSHSAKDLLTILETYPRDELFQVGVNELLPVVLSVLRLQERRQVRVFLRRDEYDRFVSCLVYLPRDRYITKVRLRMEAILRAAFAAENVDYSTLVSESVLARLHFVVRVPPGEEIRDVDTAALEADLAEATRSWLDDLADALVAQLGEEEAARLLRLYPDAFPEAYKEDFHPRAAVADLRRIDALEPDSDQRVEAPAMSLYAPSGAVPGERRFKLFRRAPVSLAQVLPILQRLGVEVLDERPYELVRADGAHAYIYDFGLRYEPSGEPVVDGAKELFQEAFAAVWAGEAENDGFNGLVLRANLGWRQAAVLRAYAKYLRQGGSTFSQDYLEQALTTHYGIARALVTLFEARFDPAAGPAREQRVQELVDGIGAALDEVANLDQDRILRSFLGLITATLRTNYFTTGPDGRPRPYLSLKLDPQVIPDLPAPRPRFELWVYSPRVEGVHLRFGPVARGGLRWSDRREDFRTEVLGLVKAQMVKNAVIVPTGAKGGFVVKRPPADPGDRDAQLAEAQHCYRLFISGMLDVTDNLAVVDGRATVVPPPAVVRADVDDPYLVVAADKGTATFSDLANGVAASYGFWLGDAFASGGSAGYDHKAMGITARGAWESVKRHFRELGRDTQSEDVTVVGVGDMSGDVFGNGMLLSEHLRLVAAFDHRHVFLDPDPDASASFQERRRLFALPRSSWADYDPARISAGGGVHVRTAKSIPLSPQVKARLGIDERVEALTPAELIRAILTAPVDLLWNGGIGTYVKATTESNAQVGDKANDAVRVDGAAVRALVIGEGGNLGLTQLGRIEYALQGADGVGGRVNTDAIDNSAGVDTSDHEVNIKILLNAVVQDGDLTGKQRNELLAVMTDEVARLVLRDNYEQNTLLGNARVQAASMLPVHRRLITALEASGDLVRPLEFLPPDAVLEQRTAAGQGLTSPEFSVLVAYAKILLKRQLLASELPDEAWFTRALRAYFPHEIVDRYDDRLAGHRLRREIIVTAVANDLVNRGGITFAFRAAEETGAGPAEIARAYTVAREVFDFERYWAEIEALDTKVPTRAQSALYLEGRRLLDRSTRWLLQRRRTALDVQGEIARFQPVIRELAPRLPELLRGEERERLRRRASELEELGVPAELGLRAAALLDSFSLLDITEIAGLEVGVAAVRPAEEVAGVYFALSERFQVDRLLTRITGLPRGDRWQSLARSALRFDLYAALAGLAEDVLVEAPLDVQGVEAQVAAWEQRNAEGLARARSTLEEVHAGEHADLATLSVALRVIRTLVSS